MYDHFNFNFIISFDLHHIDNKTESAQPCSVRLLGLGHYNMGEIVSRLKGG